MFSTKSNGGQYYIASSTICCVSNPKFKISFNRAQNKEKSKWHENIYICVQNICVFVCGYVVVVDRFENIQCGSTRVSLRPLMIMQMIQSELIWVLYACIQFIKHHNLMKWFVFVSDVSCAGCIHSWYDFIFLIFVYILLQMILSAISFLQRINARKWWTTINTAMERSIPKMPGECFSFRVCKSYVIICNKNKAC